MDTDEFITFIREKQPIYVNNDLNIQFTGYWQNIYQYISTIHKGWILPTMYRDTIPERSSGEVVKEYYDRNTKKLINGLFLKYTSDDYAEQTYLSLQIINKDTIKILYDAQHPNNENLVLNII